jgi:PAS domain S-box-containing protein
VTELALRESEEKFRRFAANAQDMLLRLSLPDRRYEYISPASVTMTGYTPEEFYADPTLLKRLIHPAWKDYFRKEWSALLEKKASPIYEYQIIDRSERVHWFNQRNVLVTGKNDEPVAIEGIVTDVTVRKEKERELIRREQRFQAVSHNAGSWIWEVDTRGIYTYSNLAVEEILGYRPDELVGKLHFYDLFDPSVRDALKAGALEIFDSRAPFFGFVNLNRHKNGDLVILKTSGAPVYSEEGVFAGYNGIDENITERRRIEETVRRANRQLNLLSSITRHDILNKISVLKGQIALIEMDNIDPVLSEHTMMMKRVTEQIQSLIAFTQLYQDLGSHDPRWIQLDTVMPVTFLPDGITLTCDLGNIIVFADAMFEKVFFNLLDNSVRHGQTTTGIRVSARETGDGLDIVWEDNGIGIPDSEKMLIFERGYGKNTGFGMFLVREILGLTGISIRETGIPGKGARFEMSVSEGMFRYQSDSDQTEA